MGAKDTIGALVEKVGATGAMVSTSFPPWARTTPTNNAESNERIDAMVVKVLE